MIKIGNKVFDIKLLVSDEAKRKGLKFVNKESMPKDAGVALVFKKPQIVTITMKDVRFPLDLIYVLDDTIVGLKTLEVGASDITFPKKVTAIIEIHKGAAKGVKKGDKLSGEVTIIDIKSGGVEAKEGKLHVLDENGKNQLDIMGLERVISRTHTKQLYHAAKKAHKSKLDTDYKVVGRAIVRIFNKQDTQEQLYTK